MRSYVVSVDLGKVQDYTATVIVEYDKLAEYGERIYAVRHLERYAIGTRYEEIVDHVCALLVRPPLRGNASLVLDATGVGSAVRELFDEGRLERDRKLLMRLQPVNALRSVLADPTDAVMRMIEDAPIDCDEVTKAARRVLALGHGVECYPVVITGGADARVDWTTRTWYVPKRDLVTVTQLLLQERRLKFAADLPLVAVLRAELASFRATPTTSGNERYEAREGEHDDIVLALAQGLWLAETQSAHLCDVIG